MELHGGANRPATLDQMIVNYCKDILTKNEYNSSKTAETLGITRVRLTRILSGDDDFRHQRPVIDLPLTKKQTIVVRHLLSGMNNKEIALAIQRTEKNVKDLLTKIYKNMEVHSRFELIQKINGIHVRV